MSSPRRDVAAVAARGSWPEPRSGGRGTVRPTGHGRGQDARESLRGRSEGLREQRLLGWSEWKLPRQLARGGGHLLPRLAQGADDFFAVGAGRQFG